MKVEQFDSVMLKDGRRVSITDKWDETHFDGDIVKGDSYESIGFELKDIDHVIPPLSLEGLPQYYIDRLRENGIMEKVERNLRETKEEND